MAALIYGFPSRKLTVIGVTGTKGKSTVVELVAHILQEAGKKVVASSSSRNEDTGLSMPGRFFLQRLLARGIRGGAEYAVIEVTSQGIVQSRHHFIKFTVAACTNLAPEHVEAHGSFGAYRDAKGAFFSDAAKNSACVFVVNRDDAHKEYFIRAAHGRRIAEFGPSDLPSRLPGVFNKYNVGAAEAICDALGLSGKAIRAGVTSFSGVRGRMEYAVREPFAVVVDYAVTPDSLKAAYECAKSDTNGKLVGVFGCTGGGRDVWKRPVMGRVAGEECDAVFLTDDDPYDDGPLAIIADIERGLVSAGAKWSEGENYWKISDRKEAIRRALALAKPGDTVMITGKGGDRWMRVARGKKIPWSDQDIVSAMLKEMKK